jgi:hypothetical protein
LLLAWCLGSCWAFLPWLFPCTSFSFPFFGMSYVLVGGYNIFEVKKMVLIKLSNSHGCFHISSHVESNNLYRPEHAQLILKIRDYVLYLLN